MLECSYIHEYAYTCPCKGACFGDTCSCNQSAVCDLYRDAAPRCELADQDTHVMRPYLHVVLLCHVCQFFAQLLQCRGLPGCCWQNLLPHEHGRAKKAELSVLYRFVILVECGAHVYVSMHVCIYVSIYVCMYIYILVLTGTGEQARQSCNCNTGTCDDVRCICIYI